jgi:hypothetical protein
MGKAKDVLDKMKPNLSVRLPPKDMPKINWKDWEALRNMRLINHTRLVMLDCLPNSILKPIIQLNIWLRFE